MRARKLTGDDDDATPSTIKHRPSCPDGDSGEVAVFSVVEGIDDRGFYESGC